MPSNGVPAHIRTTPTDHTVASKARPRLALLLTRDPGARATGRITVLRSMIKTLDRLGCDLDIFVVQKRPIMDSSWARQYQLHQIKPPSLGSVAIRALAALLSGAQTLNECLYRSPKTHRVVRSAVSLAGAQAVIADGIRLAELAHRTGLPYLLDLDDPLSDRYEALVSANSDTSAILGYFAASIPRWLTGPATRLARLLLAR